MRAGKRKATPCQRPAKVAILPAQKSTRSSQKSTSYLEVGGCKVGTRGDQDERRREEKKLPARQVGSYVLLRVTG